MCRRLICLIFCVLTLVTTSAHADKLSGLADVTVVNDAIVSLRYAGTEYVVANGDLVLGTTTRWYVIGGVEYLWPDGDPIPAGCPTVSGASNPKVGDIGAKADNFLFRLNGATDISSIDGINFQQTIFPFLTDTFFLFERGGNDTGTWQAIRADGSLGAPVAFSAASVYANTGVNVNGQNAFGVVFTTDVPVQGVRITAPGHDTLSISTPKPRVSKFASNPQPDHEAADVPRDVTLSWTPGEFANTHDVYFGTVRDNVNNGNRNNPLGVLASQGQDTSTYDAPGLFDFGQTYYWRVDEVNGPPDYTVYKGDVWSFTTELIAYPIGNVTATASSQAVNRGPENTINGSGLDASGLLHGKEGDKNMWLSAPAGPQPTWIRYEFDKVYKLHELWVWNSNDGLEPVLGFGLKDVSIEYSANGIDYTTLGTTHQFGRAPGESGYAHNTTVDLGEVAAKYVRLTVNSNWGGILNQYGLSEVRFFHIPMHAKEPNPASGAKGVSIGTIDAPVDVTLSFRAGRDAAKHNIYFSADQQTVIGGTAPVATVTKASYGPLSLDLAKTYYWRVDEVNEAQTPATWQGDIWNFTTQEYFVVDDFESYNDLDTTDPKSNRIFNAWIDGYGTATNGSIVGYENPPFAERTIVHGGKQSMPFIYSNTAGKTYSEAERTFAVVQDWTKAGSQTLVLYFQGVAGNTGQLYVKVNGSKVVYGGAADDIAKPQWKQWNIALSTLGVNLQRVTKLAVGIDGNGASGKLCFDDARLYRLAP